MSGELVAGPIVLPVAVLAGAVVLTGSVAAVAVVGIKALIEQRIEAGRLAAVREKAKISEWQQFHHSQFEDMQSSRREFNRLKASMARLSKKTAAVHETSMSKSTTGLDYLAVSGRTQLEKIHVSLEDIATTIDQVPASLSVLPVFEGIVSLRDQFFDRLRTTECPRYEEVESLNATLSRTLQLHLEKLAIQQQEREKGLERLNCLLDQVLVYLHLTDDPLQKNDLLDMKRHFLRLLNADEMNLGTVSMLEESLEEIMATIDTNLAQQSLCPVLAESIAHHLGEMNYRWIEKLEKDPKTHAYSGRIQIPGGEQVLIKVHKNGEIAFKLVHEGPGEKEEFDAERLQYFRTQEARWCSNANELLGRLAGEGFSYQIRLARDIPEDRIEIVRVESVEEILEAEERLQRDQAYSNRRTMT